MIDAHLRCPWPAEVLDAVARFKQGHLVESPPFFYVAAPKHGVWNFTREAGDPNLCGDLLEVAAEDTSPYGLITTQTCDLNEQSVSPKQPWIKIAPVYPADSILKPGQDKQITNHAVGHLVKLTNPMLPTGFWVADLRIEVPIEKSWLVGRRPIAGFADEAGYLKLAERLARRCDRPALANVISEEVVRALKQGLQKLSKTEKAELLQHVKELRLLTDGNRLNPVAAQLMVITVDNPAPLIVQKWFDEWWDMAQAACDPKGLILLGNQWATLTTLTAADYVASIPLDFAYLSPDD